MVSNQVQGEEKQRQNSIEGSTPNAGQSINFDSWAIAVRQQMIAALKKREGNRVNWE